LPTSGEALVWNFVDPATSEQPDPFRHTFREIHERVRMFAMRKSKANPG
jgi:ArsR family transcriptional regulator